MFMTCALMSGLCFGQMATLRYMLRRVDQSYHAGAGCLMAALALAGIVFALVALAAKAFGVEG